MKTLVSAVVLAFALAGTAPAFAADVTKAKTQADCDKAGGMWHADSKTCTKKSSGGY